MSSRDHRHITIDIKFPFSLGGVYFELQSERESRTRSQVITEAKPDSKPDKPHSPDTVERHAGSFETAGTWVPKFGFSQQRTDERTDEDED